jgi:polar amino acid transport system substrate-binding protein
MQSMLKTLLSYQLVIKGELTMCRKLCFLFITCIFFLSTHAAAQELTVITEEYPPINFLEKGIITGSSAEVVREVLRRLNLPDNITILPWVRGYNLLKSRPNVVLFSTTRTKERERLFHWIGPLCTARNGFYKIKGSAVRINSLEDAKRVGSIATYKEDFREQLLKSLGFKNLDSSKSAKSNLKKLMSGRVDLWISDSLGMPSIAQRSGVDPSDLELVFTINEVNDYIAISKETSKEIVKMWRATLQAMKDDGTFYRISKKWLPENCIPNLSSRISDESTLSVPLKIYTEDSPPANYSDNGKPAGMSVKIVREILNRLNKKVNIEIVPWARGYSIALTRPNVALFSTTRLPQREDLFKWVGPLYTQMWGFYAKKGSGLQIDSLEEAKKVPSIGTYLNDAKEQFLKKRGFTNLITANKNISNIKHLINGDIDLWVSSDLNMPYLAGQAGVSPEQLEVVCAFRSVENYIAFSNKTSDAVVAAWQKTLDEMKRVGFYSRLVSR